jgi:hypothetical protein
VIREDEWQHLFETHHFCHYWLDVVGSILTAMMLTLIALVVVAAIALVLVDGHRSGRHPFRMVQFRPAAPLVGPVSSARVTHRD